MALRHGNGDDGKEICSKLIKHNAKIERRRQSTKSVQETYAVY